ncbi:MAG: ornithine carbamoyltransferase [Desulfomonile tiedjei]|uniref:Ornithine carbamoyltransferase n=1 Tax=Desulfomonile tiedjei TaxID=2358 RepID=A0A9D6V4G4_9BACT|nr:ornithine carbamoyltransferase [Desulfomonile tiedjei]
MAGLRHFLTFQELSREEILSLLDRSRELKAEIRREGSPRPLDGRTVGMIFEKPSTRTRVSFEVGIHQLGGQAVFLSARDIQIGRGEPVRDTARVLSRYLDALVIRCYGHEILEEFVKWATVPVVNGLSDLHHPCQILGDLLTLQEAGLDVCSMKASWIGDGNNVANSWIDAAAKLGFTLNLACPEGYDPSIPFNSDKIFLTRDPVQAIKGADVVSTDVWASMGQESEIGVRQEVFKQYQVNSELLKHAADPVYVLHCLPAHRGEEITDEVMESRQSLVWEQAENRLHVQKAILEMLFKGL